jgi:DNA-3-methyladenine glycosylase I
MSQSNISQKINIVRCPWVPENDDLYAQYHDTHWGIPCTDESTLFEFLVLEGAQAGLSWRTVLARRESYREAFANYDISRVAQYTETDVERLLKNTGIIRHRLKVASAINNAKVFLQVQQEFGAFGRYLWKFVDYTPIQLSFSNITDYPTCTELSDKISKDLKKRGFSFVGTTIMYAYMQAIGMVNDHSTTCFCRELCKTIAPTVREYYNS